MGKYQRQYKSSSWGKHRLLSSKEKDDDCSNVVERRKQAKLKFLQDPTQLNMDNYHTERREINRTLRNKKRDYLKGKLSEIDQQ